MNLYQILEQQLKKDPALVDDKGALKHWVVVSKAQNQDEGLIKQLLENEILLNKFFISCGKALVFKQNMFLQFFDQKSYLPNSYTRYKTKIGLSIGEKFLKQHNEIALLWPYKDCILEGGQSKEEEKKQEVFFNELLAHEEITQLLEPKVLSNAKRFNRDGEKTLKNFRRDASGEIQDNLIIRGNNLLALHSLKSNFTGRIKLIYIDPPYNTGNDGFNYNDSFNRATWLTFMKNRMEAAKQLLHRDGAIFVQCDDNEQAYLKVLMDEIFGHENYRETIVVKTSTPSGVNAVNVKRGERLFKVKEYLLFYSKNPDYRFKPIYVKSEFNPNYRYEVTKENAHYCITDLAQQFSNSKELETYALNHFENIYSLEKNNKKAGEKMKQKIAESKDHREVIEFINSKNQQVLVYNGGVFIPLKDRVVSDGAKYSFGTLISDLWNDEIFQSNQTEGGVSLPGGKKPEKLLKRILDLCTNENDYVLDYHLGSGTTAAVAHKMQRRYIGIEQLDYGENDALQRLQNVIAGESTGITKSIHWKGGGEFVYLELKKYNQYFAEKILAAANTNELLTIWEQMKSKSFLDYRVDIHQQEKNLEEFKSLAFAEQQKLLIEMLDKNQLYVNVSSLDDADRQCNEHEKTVTKSFYGLNA